MADNHKQLFFLGVLLTVLLGALAIGIPRTHFSASVVDLLPGEGIEISVLRELAEQDQGRLINVRLFAEGTKVSNASKSAFIEHLQSDPHIEKTWIADFSSFEEAGKAIFANRYQWILPFWLDQNFPGWQENPEISAEDLAQRVVRNMNRYLESPEGVSLVETIPMDPFILMDQVLSSTKMLSQPQPAGDTFIWVRQKDSPFSSEGQGPVFAALESALEKARLQQSQVDMEYSGMASFAAASKAKIKSEIERLNLLGLLLVFVITFIWVRNLRTVGKIFLVIGIALAVAAATVITVFPSVHVISLVIGSILTGIAVDYAFHLLLVEPHGLRRNTVTKVVITGSLSSALGFIVLIFAPLPFLNQVGAFVGTGLIAALLAAILLRPGQKEGAEVRQFHLNPFSLPAWTGPLLLLLFLPGLQSVGWKDRISDLEYPLPALKETDLRLRQHSSPLDEKALFLVHGSTAAEARKRLLHLQSEFGESDFLHLGRWIPDSKEIERTRVFFQQRLSFMDYLRSELVKQDYFPEKFKPFSDDWETYLESDFDDDSYNESLERFAATLPGPLANMLHLGNNISWFLVLAPKGFEISRSEGVLKLDQSSMLSDAFSSYRKTMIGFSGSCLFILASSVVIAYGISIGTIALAIPSMAVLIFAGLSSYSGTQLGLFHVVGILLAFCIGLDYALFAVVAHRKRFHLPGSVCISALTTLGVFAILASSNLPAIRLLAQTVLIIIVATLVLIKAGWPFLRRGAVPGNWCFRLLPHGKQAFFIDRVETISNKEIRMSCKQDVVNRLDATWMIEAMAQSAAVLLADTFGGENQPRSGMLVVVQKCRISPEKNGLQLPVSCNVESCSDAREGLLLFKGNCQDKNKSLLAEATFSIFIPPEEDIHKDTNG